MSEKSNLLDKIVGNKDFSPHVLFSLLCLLLGFVLLFAGLVKYFPPINPYGYPLTESSSTFIFITGGVFILISIILFILGTRKTIVATQMVTGGVVYLYLRQYLLNRSDTRIKIYNNLFDLPTRKSIVNVDYLLSETDAELTLLKSLSPYLLLMLEDESEDSILTEIVEIIGKTKTLNTEKIILEMFKKDYFDLKIACVRSLGELGSSKSKRELHKLLESPHKLDGRLLNAVNKSIKKLIVESEYVLILKNELFDERIPQNIRDTYIQSALEDLGTDEAVFIVKAYQLSRLEGIDINSAYEQLISNRTKKDEDLK
jgi:hypothetical protein